MTVRHALKPRRSRLLVMLIAIFASIMVVQSGVVRAQTSGNLAQIEIQLAPFLAAGGTLEVLC
ncbi:MAG: hypothetical protein AAFV54_15130, partial [Pseudomonadota bacterium]